jgi:thiamine-phosphate pyrophosphorylase
VTRQKQPTRQGAGTTLFSFPEGKKSMSPDQRRVSDSFGLYVVLTNPVRGYEYLTHVCAELQLPFVQLRMKDVPEYRVLRTAEKLRKITERTPTKLIINDFPRVARDCAADGVHCGQDDLQFDRVRAVVGSEMIVGLSTHNPEQTEKACGMNPEYIGIGPVYATPTKKIADPVIGIDGMKAMLEKATVPAVCIGGITGKNLPDVLKAGAKNFCMVRPICESQEPEKTIREILRVYADCMSGITG